MSGQGPSGNRVEPLARRTVGRLMEIAVDDPGALVPPASELGAAREEAESDPDVWAVLVRATGPDSLAAADIASPPEAPAPTFEPWSKPLILVARGIVSGGGFELATCADVLVATAGASFLLPGAGGRKEVLARTFAQLPYRVVTALAMGRRPLPAERAHELGFVNELATEADLDTTARRWCELILAVSPLAAGAIREAAAEGSVKTLSAAIESRYGAVERYGESADAAEAVKALVEGRRPSWRGR